MKQFHMIAGLPRSGSTLLSSILSQNPQFHTGISDPLNGAISRIIREFSVGGVSTQCTEEQKLSALSGFIDGYYNHIDKPIVFNTSRYWTGMLHVMDKLRSNAKVICCVRDIPWIINSFEIINKKNPFHTTTLVKPEFKDNVFSRSDAMMDKKDGIIAKHWISLQEGYAINPEMIYFVEYKNLCESPEEEMRNIYEFLEKPYYQHDFENVEYSNENFDRFCNLKDLHTVRKKVEYKEQKKVLPPEIWEKYESMNMEFWRKDCKSNSDTIDKLNKKFIQYN